MQGLSKTLHMKKKPRKNKTAAKLNSILSYSVVNKSRTKSIVCLEQAQYNKLAA